MTQVPPTLEGLDIQALLEGRYEAERLPRDFSAERMVPDFGFNVLNLLGLLYRPVVDEKHLASGGKKPIWPNRKPFAVCLTHDVDHISAYSVLQPLRSLRTPTTSAPRLFAGTAWRVLRNAIRWGRDPLHRFERWLNLESTIKAHSTFFVLPECVTKPHRSDGVYRFSDKIYFDGQRSTVAEMMREIRRRGWEIGLHASWYSFDDVDELRRQKEQIERAVDHDIVSVRQHWLHYDVRVTPRVLAEAGFEYDSTLGFNDNVGFRFGTSYPWHLCDLGAKRSLPILEVPLIVQDRALLTPLKGLRLDDETAFRYIVYLAGAVEQVGGVLTLLWHTDALAKDAWWQLYVRVLEYLHARDAWFGTVADIGRWWRSRREGMN